MYCQIGPMVVDVITPFETLDGSHGQDFAEHSIIGGKPRLQSMGPRLSMYQFTYHFHCGMTKSPKESFYKLKNLMDSRTAVPFLFGDGTYKGMFVITDLTEGFEFQDGQGRVIELRGSMTLKEYVPEDSQSELKEKAEGQKTAVKNPALSVTGLPNSLPTVIKLESDNPSLLVKAVDGLTGGVTGLLTTTSNGISSSIGSITSPIQHILGSVTSPMNSVMSVFGNATGQLSAINGALGAITGGKVNINGALNSVNTFTNNVGQGVTRAQTITYALGTIGNSLGSITRMSR